MNDDVTKALAVLATNIASAIPPDQTKYRYLVNYYKTLSVDDFQSIFHHYIKLSGRLYRVTLSDSYDYDRYLTRKYDIVFLHKIANGIPIPLGTWASPNAFLPRPSLGQARYSLLTSSLIEATKARLLGATILDIYPGKPDAI